MELAKRFVQGKAAFTEICIYAYANKKRVSVNTDIRICASTYLRRVIYLYAEMRVSVFQLAYLKSMK